jgi:hypothetical protein
MFGGLVASFIISPDFPKKNISPDLGKVLTRWYCSSPGLSGMSATVAVFRNESMQPHRHAWIQDGYRSLAPLLVRAVTWEGVLHTLLSQNCTL